MIYWTKSTRSVRVVQLSLFIDVRVNLDILDTRMRTRDRKTAFQKNLEKLKRLSSFLVSYIISLS